MVHYEIFYAKVGKGGIISVICAKNKGADQIAEWRCAVVACIATKLLGMRHICYTFEWVKMLSNSEPKLYDSYKDLL